MSNESKKIFHEAETKYSHQPHEFTSIFPRKYQWFHFKTVKTGISSIYCKTNYDLLKLINHWNRISGWKYCALSIFES